VRAAEEHAHALRIRKAMAKLIKDANCAEKRGSGSCAEEDALVQEKMRSCVQENMHIH
jgi:hypothetical protein